MRKIILVLALAFMITACECGPENGEYKDNHKLKFGCINGHLYILNNTSRGFEVFTPLFAADSDSPMLVRCPQKGVEKQQ